MPAKSYSIRNPRRLARWLTGLASLNIAVLAVVGGYAGYIWMTYFDIAHGRRASPETLKAARMVLLAASPFSLLVIVGLLVLFLAWTYRVTANAHAMGARGLHFGALTSVLVFFIPVLNLILPPILMDEIWRASISARDWRAQKHSPLVAVWWGLQLAVICAVLLVFITPNSAANNSLSDATPEILYVLLAMPLFVVMPLLVNRITSGQRRQQRV